MLPEDFILKTIKAARTNQYISVFLISWKFETSFFSGCSERSILLWNANQVFTYFRAYWIISYILIFKNLSVMQWPYFTIRAAQLNWIFLVLFCYNCFQHFINFYFSKFMKENVIPFPTSFANLSVQLKVYLKVSRVWPLSRFDMINKAEI